MELLFVFFAELIGGLQSIHHAPNICIRISKEEPQVQMEFQLWEALVCQ